MTARRLCIALVFMLGSLFVQACSRGPESTPASTAESWADVPTALIEDYLKAHPVFAVVAGRHEYDGQLPDWSAGGIATEIQGLHAARDRATALADGALAEAERFERDYFVARIDSDLFWLETAEAPFLNPAWYLGAVDSLDPAPYLTRNYAPPETRMRAYTAYARAVPRVRHRELRAWLGEIRPNDRRYRRRHHAAGRARSRRAGRS